MAEKYYTPNIEEFNVGFTYEFGKDYLGEYLWTEIYIDHADVLNVCEIEKQIEEGHIRIKYLDEIDIKEEGFVKRVKDEWVGWHDYILDTVSGEIGYFLKATIHKPRMDDVYKIYLHRYLEEETKIEPKVNEGESELVYKGRIKNISELRRILKMLAIK